MRARVMGVGGRGPERAAGLDASAERSFRRGHREERVCQLIGKKVMKRLVFS